MRKEMDSYQTSSHITYLCRYHVIFCPKYRRRILKDGLDDFIKKEFLRIAERYKFEIIEMEVMPDHVHLLISCNPRFGIMKCISRLKGDSTQSMHNFDPSLKHRLPTIWTRSAFVSTVDSISTEIVKNYIENQKTN